MKHVLLRQNYFEPTPRLSNNFFGRDHWKQELGLGLRFFGYVFFLSRWTFHWQALASGDILNC